MFTTYLIFMLLYSCSPTYYVSDTIENEQHLHNRNVDAQWTPIFNGENLNGWTPKIKGFPLGENFGKTFRVDDGILSVRYDAYGDDFNDRFGALYYKEKLSDFRIKVTYRFVGETAPGAPVWGFRDSGVQFFCQPPESVLLEQPFPVSLEYNLHGGDGSSERPVGQVCANGIFIDIDGKENESYCTDPEVKRTFHGDQWVTLEIDVKDGNVQHFVNGELILSYSNPRYNPKHEIAKTLIENGDFSIRDGYVSIQSNSHPLDIKSIELKQY